MTCKTICANLANNLSDIRTLYVLTELFSIKILTYNVHSPLEGCSNEKHAPIFQINTTTLIDWEKYTSFLGLLLF